MNTHLYYRIQLRGELRLMEINDDGVREGDEIVEKHANENPRLSFNN